MRTTGTFPNVKRRPEFGSVYIGQEWGAEKNIPAAFMISHLEVVTQSGLVELSTRVFRERQLRNDIESARKPKSCTPGLGFAELL
jgi:hypothetical protein